MNYYDELFNKLYDVRNVNRSFVVVGKHKVIKAIERRAKTLFNVADFEDVMSSLNMNIYKIFSNYEKRDIKPISYIAEYIDDETNEFIAEFNRYLYGSLYHRLIDMYDEAKKKSNYSYNIDDYLDKYYEEDYEYFYATDEGKWIAENIDNVLTEKQKQYFHGEKYNKDTSTRYRQNIKNRVEKAYDKSKTIG